MSNPKIRILKFESKTCGYCASMNKRRVVELIADEHPGTEVVTLTISDGEGETPEGTPYQQAYEISDMYGVQALPCYIIQDERGVEFGRIDGASSLGDFRKEVARSIEDMQASISAHARIEAYRAAVK